MTIHPISERGRDPKLARPDMRDRAPAAKRADVSDANGGSRLARNVVYNILGQGAPLLAALIAIPFLDDALGTGRYGLLLIVWTLIGYVGLFDLGIGRALTKLVAERLGARDDEQIPALVWTALVLTAILGIFGAALLALLVPLFLPTLTSELTIEAQRDCLNAFLLLAASVPVVVCTACLSGILAARQRFDLINAMRAPTGVYTFAGPLLVLPFFPTLFAVVIVLVVGRVVLLILHALFCLRELPSLRGGIQIRKRAIRPLVSFGGWMTVSNIISPLMVFADRVIIGFVLAATAVAYYATPWEVVTKLLIIPTAAAGVLFPSISFWQQRSATQVRRIFSAGLKLTGMVLLPLCMIVVAGAETGLIWWLGDDYAAAGALPMQILAVGCLVNGMAAVPFALIQGVGRPDVTAKLHMFELPVYFAILFALIYSLGLVGVAIAWTARAAIDFFLLLLISRRFVGSADSEITRIALAVLGGISFLGVLMVIDHALLALAVAIAATIVCSAASWRFLLSADESLFLHALGRRVVRWRGT